MAKHTGTIAWFNNSKGYGFITSEGLADTFCHFSAIESDGYKTLAEGEAVEFDIEDGEKGKPQAARVKKLK